jgi:hypothetical protein
MAITNISTTPYLPKITRRPWGAREFAERPTTWRYHPAMVIRAADEPPLRHFLPGTLGKETNFRNSIENDNIKNQAGCMASVEYSFDRKIFSGFCQHRL